MIADLQVECNLLFQERHHADVLSQLCDLVLGPNCFILRECEVGTSEVPHGIFNLVAGVEKEESTFTLGVTVGEEELFLQDSVGMEAKTPNTMRVDTISELIQLVTLSPAIR